MHTLLVFFLKPKYQPSMKGNFNYLRRCRGLKFSLIDHRIFSKDVYTYISFTVELRWSETQCYELPESTTHCNLRYILTECMFLRIVIILSTDDATNFSHH